MTSERPKILIVDDRRENRVALRRRLAGMDADLLEAASGNDALASAIDSELALILLDVQMPEMDGYEVARLLREEESTRAIPIIFLTAAYRDDAHRRRAYGVGAVDYIEKPIDDEILVSKVTTFLDLFWRNRQLQSALSERARSNRQLRLEIEQKRQAEAELVRAHQGLERRVQERTEQLQAELVERRRAEDALRESEERFRSITEAAHDAIISFDESGRIVAWNRAAQREFRYDTAHALRRNADDLFSASQHREWRAGRARLAALGSDLERGESLELMALRAGGSTFPAEISLSTWTQGHRRFFCAILRNSSARREAERQQRLARTVFETTTEGILVTDRDNRIVAVNPAFTTLTGYSTQEARGKDPKLLASGRHDRDFYEGMWDAIQRHGRWAGEIWNRRKNGEEFPEQLSIAAIRDNDGRLAQFVGVFSDITDRKRAESVIERQAKYDSVCGLPNRSLFLDRLANAIRRCDRDGTNLTLMFIDLDRFKAVNDTFGHAAGDQLLVQVAERLGACVRAVDTVARLGGDEFTVLLADNQNPADAGRLARRILDAVSRPYVLLGRNAHVSASIGVTCYPQDASDLETLLNNADAAMYTAKNSGRNTFRFFTRQMDSDAHDQMQLGALLRGAKERNELAVHYQPIIEMTSGRLVACEALLRWHHPERGAIPPSAFIPLAEEMGYIVTIGDWVIEQAVAQLGAWRRTAGALAPDFAISVNIAARQLREPDLAERIAKALSCHDLSPERLAIEITECSLVSAENATRENLRHLREQGVRLVVDDFATGSSALQCLQQSPVHALKIDRHFVGGLGDLASGAPLAQAVIAIAHSLELEAIAEGVENEGQLLFLRENGCDCSQGFFISPALPADEFMTFAKDWAKNSSASPLWVGADP